MRDINLSGIDLNLLPQLAALLRRCNVTHAADDVGLSQPAMSRALGRLRDELGDPLLVRGRRGLMRTPRAERLLPRLEVALIDLAALFREPRFDPAFEDREIRIAASDTHTVLMAGPVMARLAEAAPNVRLRFEPYGPDLADRMERGTLDLAFALASTPLPAGVVSEPIAIDRLALVMRRMHPAAGSDWTLADYGLHGHAVVALTGDGRSETDALLASHGVTRTLALVAPNFATVVATVAATDLVTTISRAFAERLAGSFDLVIKEPPFADVALPLTLVWNGLRVNDPMLAWIRALIGEVARGIYDAP